MGLEWGASSGLTMDLMKAGERNLEKTFGKYFPEDWWGLSLTNIICTYVLNLCEQSSLLNDFWPDHSPCGASDAQDHLIHKLVGEVLSFRRQRDVRIGGRFHLERNWRPSAQWHTHLHKLVTGHVERTLCCNFDTRTTRYSMSATNTNIINGIHVGRKPYRTARWFVSTGFWNGWSGQWYAIPPAKFLS